MKTLKFKPCRSHLHHTLDEDDFDQWLEFCETFLIHYAADSVINSRIIWTDETMFKMNGLVNRHNSVYWSDLNSPSINVWLAFLLMVFLVLFFFFFLMEQWLVILTKPFSWSTSSKNCRILHCKNRTWIWFSNRIALHHTTHFLFELGWWNNLWSGSGIVEPGSGQLARVIWHHWTLPFGESL